MIVYSGTFTRRKGTLPTIEAFAKLCKEIPSVHLIVIGAGELEGQVIQMIKDLEISQTVTLLPWQMNNDLAPIYAEADIMVHPSVPFEGWEEQMGLLMVQAQSCGLPVITSRTGSLEETVLNGKTGILIDTIEPVAIYKAMKQLLLDEKLRLSMSHAARQYVVEHFSSQATARKMEEFLNSL